MSAFPFLIGCKVKKNTPLAVSLLIAFPEQVKLAGSPPRLLIRIFTGSLKFPFFPLLDVLMSLFARILFACWKKFLAWFEATEAKVARSWKIYLCFILFQFIYLKSKFTLTQVSSTCRVRVLVSSGFLTLSVFWIIFCFFFFPFFFSLLLFTSSSFSFLFPLLRFLFPLFPPFFPLLLPSPFPLPFPLPFSVVFPMVSPFSSSLLPALLLFRCLLFMLPFDLPLPFLLVFFPFVLVTAFSLPFFFFCFSSFLSPLLLLFCLWLFSGFLLFLLIVLESAYRDCLSVPSS